MSQAHPTGDTSTASLPAPEADAQQGTDWSAWSREAVETMVARNAQWPQQWGLGEKPAYRWDLNQATLTLQGPQHEVVATVCLVGTTSASEGTFVWSWANPAIPPQHGQALEVVHDFGRENQLALLTTASIPGGLPEATECTCIAARLQHALGTFVDQQGDVTLYFTLLHLRMVEPHDVLAH